MIEENEKRNQFMRNCAVEMLVNVTARLCDDVTAAKENGLKPSVIVKLKSNLKLLEKVIDVADTAFDNNLIHCVIVGIPKKRTQEAEPETNQESTSEELNPNDEPVEPQPTTDANETPNHVYKECPEC